MGSKSRRIRKARVPQEHRIAAAIGLPAQQIANDRFETCDVVNFSSADTSQLNRTIGAIGYVKADKDDEAKQAQRKTLRRTTKLKQLWNRQILDDRGLAACEWYYEMHSARYDTLGTTPGYGSAGGRDSTNFDHMPKSRQQLEAYEHFDYARAGISPSLLSLFEGVVLYGLPLVKRSLAFRIAVEQLERRIEGRVQL